MSLDDAAATPRGILGALALNGRTLSTVKGSGKGTEEVSESPLRSTSRGAGGLIFAMMKYTGASLVGLAEIDCSRRRKCSRDLRSLQHASQ